MGLHPSYKLLARPGFLDEGVNVEVVVEAAGEAFFGERDEVIDDACILGEAVQTDFLGGAKAYARQAVT